MAKIILRSSRFFAVTATAILFGLSATARANEIQVNYNLAANATGAPIAIPAINMPVSMTCTENLNPFRGVGQATFLRDNPPTNLYWVGMDLASGLVERGVSNVPGTHIVYCDNSATVGVEVFSAFQFQIHNTAATPASGVINFIW